jgi:hypothetical protein
MEQIAQLGFIHPLALPDFFEPAQPTFHLFRRIAGRVCRPGALDALHDLLFGRGRDTCQYPPRFITEFDGARGQFEDTDLISG